MTLFARRAFCFLDEACHTVCPHSLPACFLCPSVGQVVIPTQSCATTLHNACGTIKAKLFLSNHFSVKQALAGLNGDKSSLLMIPSMVDVLPTGCAAGACCSLYAQVAAHVITQSTCKQARQKQLLP